MELSSITEQNPWWRKRDAIVEDEKVVEALKRTHHWIPQFKEGNRLLIGPRQVGKTTYLKLHIKQLIDKQISPQNIVYFSCEPLKHFEAIIELVRFADILTQGSAAYFFFDEVTFVPEWQRAIKYLLDSPLKKGKIFA